MNKPSKLITLSQHRNKWQSDGVLKLDPTHISYIEHICHYCGDDENHGHSKIHTIFGQIVEVAEPPKVIEDIVNEWYQEQDKNDDGKIILSKDDIIKNLIFKNLTVNT